MARKSGYQFINLSNTNAAARSAQAQGSRFKPIPILSPRSCRGMPMATFKDDQMVLNATFVQQMESEKIAAFSILVNDDSQELALRVFTQDEARTLDEEFLQNNNLCALKQAKEEKNKSQRINIVSAMQRRPWLQELMAQVDEHKRRRYPKWDEDESAYILQAAE